MNMLRPVVGVPLVHGDEVAGGVGGWAGGWVEEGLVGLAGVDGLLHRVVDFKDYLLGPVLAVLLFVLPLDDGECFHDVVDGVPRRGEHLSELRAVRAPLAWRPQA